MNLRYLYIQVYNLNLTLLSIKRIYQENFLESRVLFDKKQAKFWINELVAWLFCSKKEYIDYTLFEKKHQELASLLIDLLKQEGFSEKDANTKTTFFFENLSNLFEILLQDLNAILEFDPAAKSKSEVLLAYPGFFATCVYRIANQLHQLESVILSRLIAEYAHSKTGIDIHPGATIGKRFFIDHGTGIVIGETAIIGDNVKIYQGVTLGALSVSKDKQSTKRHPTIQDNVIIYANATILGGKTVIGKNALIGGNVWITSSIPENSMVFHKSEIIVKNKEEFPEAINFII
ncbi:MAG: serine O-acetyltransferase [Flavobacterium sp.]|jgi:serine O-acetyltransferase